MLLNFKITHKELKLNIIKEIIIFKKKYSSLFYTGNETKISETGKASLPPSCHLFFFSLYLLICHLLKMLNLYSGCMIGIFKTVFIPNRFIEN